MTQYLVVLPGIVGIVFVIVCRVASLTLRRLFEKTQKYNQATNKLNVRWYLIILTMQVAS